jgi:hypothetical protein
VQVPANAAKLARGFFYLLEFLLRCPSPGRGLSVLAERKHRRQVEISIAGCEACVAHELSDDCPEPDCGELEIARRTFRAIGGDLTWMPSAGVAGVWIVRLPCAT